MKKIDEMYIKIKDYLAKLIKLDNYNNFSVWDCYTEIILSKKRILILNELTTLIEEYSTLFKKQLCNTDEEDEMINYYNKCSEILSNRILDESKVKSGIYDEHLILTKNKKRIEEDFNLIENLDNMSKVVYAMKAELIYNLLNEELESSRDLESVISILKAEIELLEQTTERSNSIVKTLYSLILKMKKTPTREDVIETKKSQITKSKTDIIAHGNRAEYYKNKIKILEKIVSHES